MILGIMLVNVAVGAFIGMTGVAGFLLPIYYMSVCKFNLMQSLVLSFSAFVGSSSIGTYYYYKTKLLDMKLVKKMAVGNIIGAIVGALSISYIPSNIAKITLYSIILISGIRTFISSINSNGFMEESIILKSKFVLPMLGMMIAFISTISGAGGALLTIPLFMVLNFDSKKSVGIGLSSTIFISITAVFIYVFKVNLKDISEILLLATIFHILGVIIGTKISPKINTIVLKKFIIVMSIAISIYMLYKLLLNN